MRDVKTIHVTSLIFTIRYISHVVNLGAAVFMVNARLTIFRIFQVLISSQSGQFQQLEVTAALPQNKYLFEVDLAGSYCTAIDLSSTSKALGKSEILLSDFSCR